MNSIKKITALARKELVSWLNSPALYGIAVFFLVFVSIWFYYLQRFFAMDTATLRPFFSGFPLAFVFVVPSLTMRAWAEEKKIGSAEILFTLPFTEWELVWGKFLSSFVILLAFTVLTLPVPLSLIPLGYFDPGVIFSEYFGVLLLGSSAITLGLFLSSISKNQAASFVGSVVVLLALMLGSGLTGGLPSGIVNFFNYFSLSFHFESFSRGVLDTRDIAFFVLVTTLFLFLNTRALISRKWS